MELEYANALLKDNKTICFAAVSQCGDALKFCSQNLRDDYKLALTAIATRNFRKSVLGYSDAWHFVSERLKNDYDFILDAIRYNYNIINYIPQNLLSEHYFMEQAVQRNGTVIIYASHEIKQNRRIVLKAAKQNGWFLCNNDFADYRQDREVALAACCSHAGALELIPDEFKNEKLFVAELVRSGGNWHDIVENISEDILFNDEVLFDHNVLISACQNNNFYIADYLLSVYRFNKLTNQLIKEVETSLSDNESALQAVEVVKDIIELEKLSD